MRIPEAEPIYTTAYQNFKGVDFSSSIPDREHFPIAKNFIITDSVNKRNGYECISKLDGSINGIFKFSLADVERFIVHAGSKLYDITDGKKEEMELVGKINNDKSSGFAYDNGYIIATGKEFVVFAVNRYSSNETVVKGITVPNPVCRIFTSTIPVHYAWYYDDNGNKIGLGKRRKLNRL